MKNVDAIKNEIELNLDKYLFYLEVIVDNGKVFFA